MATKYEIARAELVSQRRSAATAAEIATVQARCDAGGVEFTEVELCAGVTRADAGPTAKHLADGERLVGNNACACPPSGSCVCRVLPSGERADNNAARHDRADAEDATVTALRFGALDLTKARALLGDERFAELREADELEWKAQNAVAQSSSSSDCYRGVLVAAISEAHPDLAERAATESMAWLRSQYAALPEPNDEDEESENTDMTQDDFDPFAARRATATAFARFDSQGGATSMTPAEQQAAITEAESRFDAQVGREMYFRLARALRGQDAQTLRTDVADSGKPKKNALQRAMGRLQKIYDDAESGTLDRTGAAEAAKILDSIAELHEHAGDEDDDETTAKADAGDPLQAAGPAGSLAHQGLVWIPPALDAADDLASRREKFLLANAWNMTAEERRKIMNDWALADFERGAGPDAA